MKLSDKVKQLELRYEKLENLCGEIIATLAVNQKNGNISAKDDEMFTDMIESWSTQFHHRNK